MGDVAESLAARLAAAARATTRTEGVAHESPVRGRRALLLDQYPLWHEAVELVLGRLEMEVLGRYTSSDAVLKAIDKRAPDLLVADLDTEGHLDGLTLVGLARRRRPALRIIVLTLDEEPARVSAALAAGADAYVLKAAHPEDLATAVRQSFAQSVYLATPVMPPGAPAGFVPLTARETEILQLVAEGYSNRRLAELLAVSEPTVKFHLTNVYRKLGVANRTEASRWAQRHGVLAGGGG
ncbi:MAG: LuxR C-terminal-related transcriptional regulator [Gaiellaceae bacterium]